MALTALPAGACKHTEKQLLLLALQLLLAVCGLARSAQRSVIRRCSCVLCAVDVDCPHTTQLSSAAAAGPAAVLRPHALSSTARGQGNPRKGQPIFIKTGQVYKMTWKPAPPHPDVVMCCGGALQLSWSPMDSGVVASGAVCCWGRSLGLLCCALLGSAVCLGVLQSEPQGCTHQLLSFVCRSRRVFVNGGQQHHGC